MNATDSPSLLAHTLMMVKHLNLNIGYKTRTDLPGYRPMSGDLFGQYKEGESLLPGLPFAFGLTGGKEFVEDALHNNWLVTHKEHILPAIYNRTKNVRVETRLDPSRVSESISMHCMRRVAEVNFISCLKECLK